MLETYTAVFRSRGRQLLLITLLLAPLIFLGLVARADVYRSEAILQVGAGSVAEEVLGQPRAYEEPGRRVATELEILTSTAVEQRAAQRLAEEGWEISDREVAERVVVSPRGVSNFVDVVATDANPVRARLLTQAVVESYIEYRREAQQAELERVRDDLQSRLRAVEGEVAALDASSGDDAAAARERDAVLARFETLTQLVEAVRLRLSVDSSGVRVLADASTPDGPADAVSPLIAAVLSLLGAALLGSGGLLLYDLARDTVRTRTEAERLMPARTLVQLPRFRDQDARWGRALRREEHPASVAAGTLRLRLSGMSGGTFPSPLLVTGAIDDAEDCLWVAAALAAACGRSQTPVLLIADPAGAGESLVVADDGAARVDGSSLNVSQTRLPHVWWAPMAARNDGTAGLRGTSAPAQELAALTPRFEIVILVAPVTEAVDAVAMSHLAATTVGVCAVGRSRARQLQQLVSALVGSGAVVSGMVLTSSARRSTVSVPGTSDVVAAEEPEAAEPVVADAREGRASGGADEPVAAVGATSPGGTANDEPQVHVNGQREHVSVLAERSPVRQGRVAPVSDVPLSSFFEPVQEASGADSVDVSAATGDGQVPVSVSTSAGTGWPANRRSASWLAGEVNRPDSAKQAAAPAGVTSWPDRGDPQAAMP